MAELVITSREDLEKMLKGIISQLTWQNTSNSEARNDERLNQKQAAKYLGITQATLIRWKKLGRVPCEQLPGSTKVTYFKSQLKAAMQRNPQLLH